MSQYVRNMDTQMAAPMAEKACRPDRERIPQVREQLEYLAKAIEILHGDSQRLLARITPVQRQEPQPNDVAQKDGRCEVSMSAPLASEIAAMVARIECVSRDLREGSDLLEV